MPKVSIKQPVVDEIKSLLDGAESAITVDYLGINVDQDTRLRKELREGGVSYKVFKNTLILRAVQGTDFESLAPDLKGSTALAVSKDDATAPARIIAKYAKTVESLKFKGGIVEGKYFDSEAMQQIAQIPSRDELLSRLLGSLQSPIANFARVINQIAEKNDGTVAQAE